LALDGFITQKRRKKVKSHQNGPKIQKLQSEHEQNFTQHSKLAHENQPPQKNSFFSKENFQPKEINQLLRPSIPSSPVVGASRSYDSVAKTASQDMITSANEVQIYTKKVVNNVLQINGAKASTVEKAIIAEAKELA
jgi:hypothetical protein